MSEPYRSVHVTINISETEEKELTLPNVFSLDTVVETLKCHYPTISSIVLVVSL